jgi:hypothetical protein
MYVVFSEETLQPSALSVDEQEFGLATDVLLQSQPDAIVLGRVFVHGVYQSIEVRNSQRLLTFCYLDEKIDTYVGPSDSMRL